MITIPILLLAVAIALDRVLESRRENANYYKYVRRGRRKIWVGRVLCFLLLCPQLLMPLRYPTWLMASNYIVLAVAMVVVYSGSSQQFYSTVASAHRLFGGRSPDCKVIEYFQAGAVISTIWAVELFIGASIVYFGTDGTWQAAIAVVASTIIVLGSIAFLFWLSNRRLYPQAIKRLREAEAVWVLQEART